MPQGKGTYGSKVGRPSKKNSNRLVHKVKKSKPRKAMLGMVAKAASSMMQDGGTTPKKTRQDVTFKESLKKPYKATNAKLKKTPGPKTATGYTKGTQFTGSKKATESWRKGTVDKFLKEKKATKEMKAYRDFLAKRDKEAGRVKLKKRTFPKATGKITRLGRAAKIARSGTLPGLALTAATELASRYPDKTTKPALKKQAKQLKNKQNPIARKYYSGGMAMAEGASSMPGSNISKLDQMDNQAYTNNQERKAARKDRKSDRAFAQGKEGKGIRKQQKADKARANASQGLFNEGGTTRKEEGRRNWMQRAMDRNKTRYQRFKEKRNQKPMSEYEFYTPNPDGGGSGYKHMTQYGNVHRDDSDRGRRITAATKPGSKESVRDIYLEENKARQDKSQKEWDEKTKGWKEEDAKEKKHRTTGTEKHKQQTNRPMMMKKKGGIAKRYANGGTTRYENPRPGTQSDPGTRTDFDKLKTYRNYTPEQRREQYTYWDKTKPGGRNYSDSSKLPLDENHPDYGTPNWKYLTNPKLIESQRKRGITYKYDNKGRLVRLNRQGNPVGGTKAQRNERNIIPKGPQQDKINIPKVEPKQIPTNRDDKLPKPRPVPQETVQPKPDTPTPSPQKDDGAFGDAFKQARKEGRREFTWNGKKYHTRQENETKEQWNEKFPKGDMDDVKLSPKEEMHAKSKKKSPQPTPPDAPPSAIPGAQGDTSGNWGPPGYNPEKGIPNRGPRPKSETKIVSPGQPGGKPINMGGNTPSKSINLPAGSTDKAGGGDGLGSKLAEKTEKPQAKKGMYVKRKSKKYGKGGALRAEGAYEDGGVTEEKEEKEKVRKEGGKFENVEGGKYGGKEIEGKTKKVDESSDAFKKAYAGKSKDSEDEDFQRDLKMYGSAYGQKNTDELFNSDGKVGRDKKDDEVIVTDTGKTKKVPEGETKKTLDEFKPTIEEKDSPIKLADNDSYSNDVEEFEQKFSADDTVVKPSERSRRRTSMTEEEHKRADERDRRKAASSREEEERRMMGMSERERRKYARMMARQERKMERQQMRQNRREQRRYRKTMRRKAREDRREERGMMYTGGRRISPRRWFKNFKYHVLGKESKRGEGRLKRYDEFKKAVTDPKYFEQEDSKTPVSRRTRRGRVRSGKGKFSGKRGSVDRYSKGGSVGDSAALSARGKRGMTVVIAMGKPKVKRKSKK